MADKVDLTLLHNRIVKDVLKEIVIKTLEAGGDSIDAMAMLESLMVGVMIHYNNPDTEADILKLLTDNAIERLKKIHERTAINQ